MLGINVTRPKGLQMRYPCALAPFQSFECKFYKKLHTKISDWKWYDIPNLQSYDILKLRHTKVMTYQSYDIPKLWYNEVMTYQSYDLPKLWNTEVMTHQSIIHLLQSQKHWQINSRNYRLPYDTLKNFHCFIEQYRWATHDWIGKRKS